MIVDMHDRNITVNVYVHVLSEMGILLKTCNVLIIYFSKSKKE